VKHTQGKPLYPNKKVTNKFYTFYSVTVDTTITNRNEVHEEIRERNSGNGCSYLVTELLPSNLLSK
jgi:hypothetical protein